MAKKIMNMAVHGMTCGNCARSVERKLSSTPGVAKATVDLKAALATIEYDPDVVTPETLTKGVRQLGYEVAA